MSKRKIAIITPEQRMTIQLWLGTLMAVFGVCLIIASFTVPPLGVIHSSVLAALGEILTFSGALIGIDYTYKYKKFRTEYERNKNNTDIGDTPDSESDD